MPAAAVADVEAVPTLINGRWTLLLPEHRAARPQWGDWIDGAGRARHGWEAERLASMHANLRPGDVVYDVGAEEGDLPALWASWGCHVVLAEPNPRVWPNIRFIWRANGLPPPLATWPGFLGDVDRTVVGERGPELLDGDTWWPACAGGPVIGDHGFCNLWERPDLPATTVDALVASGVPAPDALTIDVEGAELRVLLGAERTLAEHRPLVWVSVHPEFMADGYGDHPAQLHQLLAEHGYAGEHLATDHEQHWLFAHRHGRPVVLA